MKKFILFFICVPLVYSELHRFITTYTEINGQTTAGTPEFSAVTTLDDHQIDYYDSNIKKLIPKQDWMKEFTSTYMWKEYIEIREKLLQIYKNNTNLLIQRFTHSDGVHTYQRMYGCDWDDETVDSHGFDQYGYNGEDFITLDLKEDIYITSVQQALPIVMKWNNDRAQLITLKQYLQKHCVYCLRKLLYLSEATFKKTEPEVSLLQKNPDYYTCHVTGFLFRNTSILWRKNGQAMSDSSNLISGDTRPNEDGTFQRTLTLYVLPDEWKRNQYSCVVEHKSLTETIQKILTEDQIMRNEPASDDSYFMYDKNLTVNKTKWNKSASNAPYIMNPALVIPFSVGLIVLIGLCVLWKLWKKLKADRKTTTYVKTKPSQEDALSQDSLLSTPSSESSSPPEAGVCE